MIGWGNGGAVCIGGSVLKEDPPSTDPLESFTLLLPDSFPELLLGLVSVLLFVIR